MTEWKTYRLGDIADIQTGPFGSQLHNKDYALVGSPIVTVEHLGNRHFTTQNLPLVSDADKVRLSKYILSEGDIVFSRVGSVDRCSYVSKAEDGWMFSGRCLRVRCSSKAYPLYVYYYFCLESIKQHIRNVAVGATMPSINTQIMSEIPISLPSLEEQRRIAGILGAIDDKIENNRRINTNLELQAQALFDKLICDENLKYEYIANLEHSIETGRRPKGGVANIANGVPSIGAENIKGLGKYDYSKTKYITKEFAQSLKKGFIKGYELLIYKDGGKPGYFIPNFSIFGEGFPYDKMALNEHVFLLDFGNKGYNFFAYFFFQTEEVMRYLNAQGSKAAIPGINRNDVESIAIPTIENETVKEFCKRVEPIITAILTNAKESSLLATLRDTLLPKLMNGEIKL